MPGVRVLPRRLWPRLKWTTRRDVAPEEAGSSPAGHLIALRGIWDQRGLIRLARGFDSRSRDSRASCERKRRLPCKETAAGSTPAWSTHAQRRHADVAQLGEARRSDRRQCRFESDRHYHLDVAQRERTGFGSRGLEVRALPSRPMRGGGTGTTPGSEPGGPRSNRGLAASDVSAVGAP